MHHTDWAEGATRRLTDRFPTLPGHFASGLTGVHVRPNWVYTFVRGDEVHHTDLGRKAVRKLGDEFPELPESWRP
ncbi:hypothetical protein ABT147_36785 [Streptomyces sp. NPDC001868]|uniref:hypothetical protein n=1 Tax=Streptomyces sp. NPDC001868 TaxID=3154401 RepID=UPI003330BDE4